MATGDKTIAGLVGTFRTAFRFGTKAARATLDAAGLTAARTFTLPDLAGTVLVSATTALPALAGASLNEFRLSTESNAPVSGSDRTAQSTLYFTPVGGGGTGRIAAPTGTAVSDYRVCDSSQVSLPLSGLTAGKNYDVFAFGAFGGGFSVDLGPAWTNDTTRSLGLGTNGPNRVAASSFTGLLTGLTITYARLVGTVRATGATTVEDSRAKRFVWNECNRVPRTLYAEDTTSHTYASGTVRQWRAAAANQLDAVFGLPTDLPVHLRAYMSIPSAGVFGIASVAQDSTTVEDGRCLTTAAGDHEWGTTRHFSSAAGRHSFSANQRAEFGTVTFHLMTLTASAMM